jgi:protein neuralized
VEITNHVINLAYFFKSIFLALRFSRICGPTVEVDSRGMLATRVGHEFSQAYVFTSRPIKMDEDITVIVMKNTPEFMGSMAFGLTSCDPSTIGDLSALPADSDNLLERPEYWVCIKNVAVNPRAGDIATFCVKQSGEVMFRKNEHTPRAIMYVDTSVPLWAFFDLYGSTSKLRLASKQLF